MLVAFDLSQLCFLTQAKVSITKAETHFVFQWMEMLISKVEKDSLECLTVFFLPPFACFYDG